MFGDKPRLPFSTEDDSLDTHVQILRFSLKTICVLSDAIDVAMPVIPSDSIGASPTFVRDNTIYLLKSTVCTYSTVQCRTYLQVTSEHLLGTTP